MGGSSSVSTVGTEDEKWGEAEAELNSIICATREVDYIHELNLWAGILMELPGTERTTGHGGAQIFSSLASQPLAITSWRPQQSSGHLVPVPAQWKHWRHKCQKEHQRYEQVGQQGKSDTLEQPALQTLTDKCGVVWFGTQDLALFTD